MLKHKNILLITLSVIVSLVIVFSYDLTNKEENKLLISEALSTKTSTTSINTLNRDLNLFYNSLSDKDTYILNTNKFKCTSSGCTANAYTNIGILTEYEYNLVGGLNSYLSSINSFFIEGSSSILEATSSGIKTSTSSNLRPTIYLKDDVRVTGSGTASDPYILSPSGDINILGYTLDGKSTTLSYNDLLSKYAVNKITCKNGTTATWDYEEEAIVLKNIKTPDYCTIDFKDGYTVSLSAINGTVSAPTSQTIGYNGSVSFTVTPKDGYQNELSTNTCGGTLSGNTYTVSKVTSSKSCSIAFKRTINEFIWSSGTLGYKLLEDNPTRSTRTDFSTTFTTTNTGTLYTATEDNTQSSNTKVYYFAGDAKNNWVKFGKWETDSVIYRGYSSTDSSYVEYSTMDACTSASSYNINCTVIKFASAGNPMYWRIIRTNADGSIRLLYSGTSPDTTSGYIGKSKFNSTISEPMYVGYMYGTSGTLTSNRTNENSSLIKTYIDTWYSNNLTSYTKYLSIEAVYCNDREIGSGTYGVTGSRFDYASYTRLYTNNAPSHNCINSKDAFSASNTEAKLTYPVGLMTADEVAYAGGKAYTKLTSPYSWYYTNSAGGSITGSTEWWLLSPNCQDGFTKTWRMDDRDGPGYLVGNSVYYPYAVRPVISIKSDALWSSGNGSAENPYEIIYN